MKVFTYLFAGLLLLVAVALALPFTAGGTRILVQLVERTGVVRAEYTGGTLFGELQLAELEIETAAVQLKLTQVASRLDPRCFLASTFCLDALAAETLSIQVAATEANAEPASPQMIDIPYRYEIPNLRLQSALIEWPGGHWQQGALEASVTIAGSRISVEQASVAEPELVLQAQPDTGDSYQGFAPTDIFIPVELEVWRLLLQRPRVRSGSFTQALESLELVANWGGTLLTLQHVALSAMDIGELQVSGSLRFEKQWPLQLLADVAFAPELAAPQLSGRSAQATLEGDLGQLSFELDSPGVPAVTGSGSVDVTAPALPYQVTATLAWPAGATLGDALAVEGTLAELTLQSPLAAEVQGTLARHDATLSTQLGGLGYESLSATAQADWQAPRLVVRELRLRDTATDSALLASGEVVLDDAWSLRGQVSSDGMQVPPLITSQTGRLQGELEVKAKGAEGSWQLELPAVDIRGELNGLPATVSGAAGLTSDLRLLPGRLQANVNGAQLLVDAPVETGSDAQLSLQLDDLGRWLAGARGSIELRGQGGLRAQTLSISGNARQISLGGMAVPELTLAAVYAGATREGSLELSAPEIEGGGYAFDDVSLSLAGTPAAHRLRLETGGRLNGALDIRGSWQQGAWQGALLPTELATRTGSWSLGEQVPVTWSQQQNAFSMAAHCWQHPEFELCAQKLQAGADGDIDLRLRGDVRAFNGFLPRGLEVRGALQSRLELAWEQGSINRLDAAAGVRKLNVIRRYGMGERASVTWESADLTLVRQGQELIVDGDVVRDGRRVLTVDATLPATLAGEVGGELRLDALQLATFSPWVTELSTLQGAVTGTVALAGTPNDLRPRGTLRLADGKLVVVGNPTELTDLNLALELDGDSGRVSGSGLLGGGEVNLRGNILSRPQLSIELAISGSRHEVLLPPASELLVSEELSLLLTEEGLLDVAGDVTVHSGVLRYENLPEGSVAVSRDVVQVDVSGQVIAESKPFDVRADILLHVSDGFRVEGDSFKATLGGDLQLRQQPGQSLQLFGNLNLQGGELFVYRQHLQIRRGTVAFSGPPANPELNVAAERRIRDEGVTVGARLIGSLEEPSLEVYSEPVMSQSEAMSYLVRGRGLDTGAAADGTALALSLGADVVNRSGIVSGLNRLPLLNNVAFGAMGEADDTAATVSGYIGDRIYLSYGIGLYEPINVLTARLYLQSRLWLEVVSRLENSVDLYYSFDIP
ncbi:hypothetical protein F0M18_00225 [Pseudohalioglobus sediminis]|uniref:Translocation and assembly module TamB C-terminal domain-containing protein n=1 Tax=Pseudohalioglobus sediminis TaxID=2606449 RepID=A0A5B0X6Q0_9GAMM|nr:translocation/assembly module TamB domain-containing protein [Pseudohalioglobus sediminis]KAA1193909.1 hypothetical protein F0M18_00225 [Pseudohalioglobus sediminis]